MKELSYAVITSVTMVTIMLSLIIVLVPDPDQVLSETIHRVAGIVVALVGIPGSLRVKKRLDRFFGIKKEEA